MSASEMVFGLHAVQAILERSPERVLELFLLKGRDDQRQQQILALAARQGLAMTGRSRQQLDDLVAGANHQGVVARVRPAPLGNESDLADLVSAAGDKALLLVLDGVTDPHNLGACLRTADAAGATAVVIPRDRAVGLTPVVRKVASGAAEHLPLVAVTNLARTLDALKEQGLWIVGTSDTADQDLYAMDLRQPVALVMGAEGQGMRRLTAERCDMLVRLPMRGSVESLNVSVAAGVCLYEALRQRAS